MAIPKTYSEFIQRYGLQTSDWFCATMGEQVVGRWLGEDEVACIVERIKVLALDNDLGWSRSVSENAFLLKPGTNHTASTSTCG